MAYTDDVAGQVSADASTTFTYSDGVGAVWYARRTQAQSLYNLRDGNGDLDWAVIIQLSALNVMASDTAEDARTALIDLGAKAQIWADQIDARVQRR